MVCFCTFPYRRLRPRRLQPRRLRPGRLRPRWFPICLVVLLLIQGVSAVAGLPLEKQRGLFKLIEKRVADKPALLDHYRDELQGYPLLPYLQARIYQKRFSRYDAEVQSFIESYAGTPFAEYLRSQYLDSLAKRGRIDDFLALWEAPQRSKRRCDYYRFAVTKADRRDEALTEFGAWWLSGDELPKRCAAIEEHWLEARPPTRAMIWERIENALRNKHQEVAVASEKWLPPQDRSLVTLAELLRSRPEQALEPQLFSGFDREEWMLRSVWLERLAWRDAETGLAVWESVRHDPRFPRDLKMQLLRTVGLSLATEWHPQAIDLLAAVPPDFVDDRVASWRIVDAFRRKRYGEADYWLAKLDPADRERPRWVYLKGRSADLQQRPSEAENHWRRLLPNSGYYGFLARAQLGRLGDLPKPELEIDSARISRIERLPGMQRASEWVHLKNHYKARREWYASVRQLGEEDVKAAVVLANRWGWADLVIYALGRLQLDGAWDYRFPLQHQQTMAREAGKFRVDPTWAYAITRQESAFFPRARSSAGALGLMQLLPGTARETAAKHRIRYRNAQDLLTPTVNIRLGVAHLGDLVDRNSGNFIWATAAYNAGQGKVDRWRRELENTPIDLWIEAIPYYETRDYVKKVMAYSAIYARQMDTSSQVFEYLVQRLQETPDGQPLL